MVRFLHQKRHFLQMQKRKPTVLAVYIQFQLSNSSATELPNIQAGIPSSKNGGEAQIGQNPLDGGGETVSTALSLFL